MSATSFRISGYRSIVETDYVPLGPITLLVGRNNAGKSAILRSLFLLQEGSMVTDADYHLRGHDRIQVALSFDGLDAPAYRFPQLIEPDEPLLYFLAQVKGEGAVFRASKGPGLEERNIDRLSAIRPNHLFVPVFGERRTNFYNEDVRAANSQTISTSDNNLTSRIDAVANPAHDAGKKFQELMNRVFDLQVSTFHTQQGKAAGQVISLDEGIDLSRMGGGISSTVGLLSELARNEHHIYLVEEPENDLHPDALRVLLEILDEYSDSNQFIITTHSDLVIRYLGSKSSTQVHKVSREVARGVPSTRIQSSLDKLQRRELLMEMGYVINNPVAWLIFEESSAQSIVEQILIPIFVPKLRGVIALSCDGATKIKATVNDLHRTILCLHLGSFKHDTWVFADNDTPGKKAIDDLRMVYENWPEGRFQNFPAPMFEEFYPSRFSDRVVAVKAADKGTVRSLKQALVIDVLEWAKAEPDQARSEFKQSAAQVISMLEDVVTTIEMQ